MNKSDMGESRPNLSKALAMVLGQEKTAICDEPPKMSMKDKMAKKNNAK